MAPNRVALVALIAQLLARPTPKAFAGA